MTNIHSRKYVLIKFWKSLIFIFTIRIIYLLLFFFFVKYVSSTVKSMSCDTPYYTIRLSVLLLWFPEIDTLEAATVTKRHIYVIRELCFTRHDMYFFNRCRQWWCVLWRKTKNHNNAWFALHQKLISTKIEFSSNSHYIVMHCVVMLL